jgi:hypothetical protein
VWTDPALDKLSHFYVTLTLTEQDELAKAVERINVLLAIRPDDLGESRAPWTRVWFESGLMLRFDIDPAQDRVTVYDLTRMRPKKR